MPLAELTPDAISFNATVATVKQGSQWQVASQLFAMRAETWQLGNAWDVFDGWPRKSFLKRDGLDVAGTPLS